MLKFTWASDGKSYRGQTAMAVVTAMRTDPANCGGEETNEEYRLAVASRSGGILDTGGDLRFLVSLVDHGLGTLQDG